MIAKPQDVFTPSYNIDRHLPQPTLSGLGATVGDGRLWDEGEGIFKPGGYGGGVFDGDISGLGSIGKRRAPRGIAMRGLGDAYPWREKNDATIAFQSTLNAHLLAKGMCPITVDGKLGSDTCGAVKFLNNNGISVATPDGCVAHPSDSTAPRKNSGGCGGGGGRTVVPSSNLPVQPLEAGMSSGTKRALGFALGGVLAIGAVVMLRKKR
jgi:hypothetical protein